MVADTFDNGIDAAVANAETFTGNTGNIGFTAGGAVEGNVADNDVFVRIERRFCKGMDDDFTAGKTLADVVVGIAFETQGDTGQ